MGWLERVEYEIRLMDLTVDEFERRTALRGGEGNGSDEGGEGGEMHREARNV